MKKTMYEPIAVSSGELPGDDKFKFCICDYYGTQLLQSGIYNSNLNFWTCESSLIKVTHWLKETIIDIPDELSEEAKIAIAMSKKSLAAVYPNESVVGVKFEDRIEVPWEDSQK